MRKLSEFPYTSMVTGDYLVNLGDQLTKQEKVLVARSDSSRLTLFENTFPDLWVWCRFTLEPNEWELDWHTGRVNKENWTFDLWLSESDHLKFQSAWGFSDETA